MGEEQRDHARGVFALAFLAGDRSVGIRERAECVEAGAAVKANVFVKRHRFL